MAALPTITEIRKMSTEDIQAEVTSIRREAAQTRLSVELSKEKNTSKMKNFRRHMARLLTVLQEKSLTEGSQKSQTMTSSISSKVTKKSAKSLSRKTKTSKIPAQS